MRNHRFWTGKRIRGGKDRTRRARQLPFGLRHRTALLLDTHQREKEEFVHIQTGLLARRVLGAVSVVALVGFGTVPALAQAKKTVTIGITLPQTGADAQAATLIKQG